MPIAAMVPKDIYVAPAPVNLVRQDKVPAHTAYGRIVGQETFTNVPEQS